MRELLVERNFFPSKKCLIKYECLKNNCNEKLSNIFENQKSSGDKTISIELSPTNNSCILRKLNEINKHFCSVSWHIPNESYLENIPEIPALKLSKLLMQQGNIVLLHITSRSLHKNQAIIVLNEIKRIGIRNLLVLQGDIRQGLNRESDFKFAVDLIRFIKENYGDHFCIGVAGYPLGHPRSKTIEQDMIHLKDKINAKADFIITQAVFDFKTFETFQTRCRSFGIKVPVVPGIFAFTSQKSLLKMSQLCDITVPEEVRSNVERNKQNPISVFNYGVHYTTELIQDLLTAKKDPVFDVHLFTLNNIYAVYEICERLGFCKLNIERPIRMSRNFQKLLECTITF